MIGLLIDVLKILCAVQPSTIEGSFVASCYSSLSLTVKTRKKVESLQVLIYFTCCMCVVGFVASVDPGLLLTCDTGSFRKACGIARDGRLWPRLELLQPILR